VIERQSEHVTDADEPSAVSDFFAIDTDMPALSQDLRFAPRAGEARMPKPSVEANSVEAGLILAVFGVSSLGFRQRSLLAFELGLQGQQLGEGRIRIRLALVARLARREDARRPIRARWATSITSPFAAALTSIMALLTISRRAAAMQAATFALDLAVFLVALVEPIAGLIMAPAPGSVGA
jgi:hypothetical protein